MRHAAVILLYHRIAETPYDPFELSVRPQRFAQQLEALRRGMHPLPLPDLLRRLREGSLPHAAVAFTFDDGYADVLTQALPLLEQFEIPATLFVVSGAIGGRGFWWDELSGAVLEPDALPEELRLTVGAREYRWRAHSQANPPPNPNDPRLRLYLDLWRLLLPLREMERRRVLDALAAWAGVDGAVRDDLRPLTSTELQQLGAHDLIQIGAHTISHPVLSALPEEEQRTEIQGSRRELQRYLERSVASFAYPYGWPSAYGTETLRLVREAGFSCACSGIPGVVTAGEDQELFSLPRVTVGDWEGRRLLRRLHQLMP